MVSDSLILKSYRFRVYPRLIHVYKGYIIEDVVVNLDEGQIVPYVKEVCVNKISRRGTLI